MPDTLLYIAEQFKGRFLTEPEMLREKLFGIKAFVFDWDGVFNDGMKDEKDSSPFSEVDAMGTNLLRFNHYLRNGQPPVFAIVSGETNKAALSLSKRESFDAAYCGIKFKAKALEHICNQHDIEPQEVAFVFDDVLDFSFAAQCGLRIMVGRKANPLLVDFAVENDLVDYITAADGGNHAVREAVELLTGISGMYKETISHRMNFSEEYRRYLEARNKPQVQYFTASPSTEIITYQPT